MSALASGSGARVVLVMPVRNEARDLPATLASLAAQSFDRSRLVFYLIDGKSLDSTREIAQAWFDETGINGAILTNDRGTIPSSLNLGIAAAGLDDIIVRLDGHTVYGTTYLTDLVGALEAAPPEVACVGGPQIPVRQPGFEQRLVATLYSNPAGLGGADHRSGQGAKYVTQVYLGAWRPGVLQQVGGFDERWEANEDSELSARLLGRGWKILWLPLDCRYRINRGVIKSIRQWGAYGYWRAQTLRRHPALAKPRHFAPPAALVAGTAIAFTPLRPLIAVGFAAFAAAVVVLRDERDTAPVIAASWLFFPACQAAWSIGFLRGIARKPQAFVPNGQLREEHSPAARK